MKLSCCNQDSNNEKRWSCDGLVGTFRQSGRNWQHLTFILGTPGGSEVKVSACNAGDLGSIPGLGRSPGEGKNNYSSILAWEIPWTEEHNRLQSMGLQRVKPDLTTNISFTFIYHHVYLGPTNWSTLMYGCSDILCLSY